MSSVPKTLGTLSVFSVRDLPAMDFPLDDFRAIDLLRAAADFPPAGRQHPSKLFSKMRFLTESSSARIYYTTVASTGFPVIVKKLRIRESESLQSYVLMEIAMTALCCASPRVVDLYTVLPTKKNIWLILEYLSGGPVSNIFMAARDFREKEIAYVMKSVLEGLWYMHRRNRIHRDIKGQNILVNTEGQVKLIDFGWTVQLTVDHPMSTLPVGSVYWMAPEVHREQE